MRERSIVVSVRDRSLAGVAEEALLRCCCRVDLNEAAREQMIELVQQEVDWDLFLQRCHWHRVRPLTYRHLQGLSANGVPQYVLDRLATDVQELSRRSDRLWETLREVAGFCREAGVRLLVFKGPALAREAYGDMSLRECGDLDLLFHRDDLPRLSLLLKQHGFRSCWEDDQWIRQVFACEFDRDGVQLDVHWDLAPGWLNYRVDFDRAWERGKPLFEDMSEARQITAEQSVVVLSIHGAKHWWEKLRWIEDIAELVSRGRVRDWDCVEAEGEVIHGRRSAALGLWLAHDLLGAELPPEAMRFAARYSGVRKLTRIVRKWLALAEQAEGQRSLRDRFAFRMGLCERMRDRVPQILHYLRHRRSSDD